MKELVSIIVPVYNMEKNVKKCIDSLLNQSYRNTEIILVNDGSKDGSGAICDEAARNNSEIKVIHTENQGSGPARNTGIAASTGKYAYFPDADDYVEPNAIEKLVGYMENGKYDLTVFGFKCVNRNGKILNEKKYKNYVLKGEDARKNYSACMGTTTEWGIQGAPWNKFFDMDVIKKNNIEYPPLRRHQDEGFIARYMCYAKNIRFADDIFYTYYENDLKKEWEKYPVDYIDAVIGLYKTRQETILRWNEKDIATHNLIKFEYLCKVVKSAELSFSPKAGLKNREERKQRIRQIADKSEIVKLVLPHDGSHKYQKIVFRYIKKGNINKVYNIIKLKVAVEKKLPMILKIITFFCGGRVHCRKR